MLRKSAANWLSERIRDGLDQKQLGTATGLFPKDVLAMFDLETGSSFDQRDTTVISNFVRGIVSQAIVDDSEVSRWKRITAGVPNDIEAFVKMNRTEFDFLKSVAEQNHEYLNTLGIAYYRLEEYPLAIETLQRSIQYYANKNPKENPANSAFLALSYLKLGNLEEANKHRELFREAEKLYEDPSTLFQMYNHRTDILRFAKEVDDAFATAHSANSEPE